MMNESPLPADLARTIARAGVDPNLAPRDVQDALRRAIATRRGYCDWTVDHGGWVVMLYSPDQQSFYGHTLEEALAWCLVWLMAPELGIGPFVVAEAQPTVENDPPAIHVPPSWVPVTQPFAVGDRVVVVVNEHYQRETLNLAGATGRVVQIYPSPSITSWTSACCSTESLCRASLRHPCWHGLTPRRTTGTTTDTTPSTPSPLAEIRILRGCRSSKAPGSGAASRGAYSVA